MSLRDMEMVFMQRRGLDEDVVKAGVKEILQGIDFLHTQAHVVHTDIHPGNLLLGAKDNSMFKSMEDVEMARPVARKKLSDRTIYCSRWMRPENGPLLISDFGEARLGPGPHAGDIMPAMYRAPEVLLRIQWSYPVDVWSVGLTAWILLEGKALFGATRGDDNSDGEHLANLIAALGPPPEKFLKRNPRRARLFWDDDGKWIGPVPIPWEKTLEALETKLEDKTKFLQFMRRALAWDPSMRPTARELLDDPWLETGPDPPEIHI